MNEPIPAMTTKEFRDQLSQFMEYMRNMADSLSHNLDVTHKFHTEMMKSVEEMVVELRSDERLTNIKTLVDTLECLVTDASYQFRTGVQELVTIRKDSNGILDPLQTRKKEA